MVTALPSQYSFLPRFFRLSLASVLSNMMVPLAGLVDTAFLGHLADIRHLAGVILASILFDYLYRVQTIFGLLTSHGEVSAQITNYSFWLVPLLQLTAVAFMLKGYFIGMKEGSLLRNMVLLAFGLGFLPLAVISTYLHSNHLLWLSLVGYMATLAIGLGTQIPGRLESLKPAPLVEIRE